MTIKGIIFDMDGTLLDSMGYWRTLGDIFCDHFHIPREKGLNERLSDGLPLEPVWQSLNRRYGFSFDDTSFTEAFYAAIEPVYARKVEPKPGVPEFLREMKTRGLRLCVATATRYSTAVMALEKTGLLPLLDFVLSVPEVGRGKKYPDIYLECTRRMGLQKEEVIVFEDALHCVKTLKRAGFFTVGVADAYTPAAEWEELAALCDHPIGDYRELLEACRKLSAGD